MTPGEQAVENALRVHDAAMEMNRGSGVEMFDRDARAAAFIGALEAQDPPFTVAALPTTPTPSKENDMEDEKTAATPDQDALDYAWTIIANAGGGDWTRETQDWQDAAARFRDQYHATLDARQSTP